MGWLSLFLRVCAKVESVVYVEAIGEQAVAVMTSDSHRDR